MLANRIFLFSFLSVIYWFLCGGPNFFEHPTSLALYGLGLAYITCIIWTDLIFSLFNGDRYTYSAAGKGIAIVIGSPAIVIIALLIRVDSNIYSLPGWLNNIGIGFILLGLLSILTLPIMSSNSVGALPKQTERRCYDNPTVANNQKDQDHV